MLWQVAISNANPVLRRCKPGAEKILRITKLQDYLSHTTTIHINRHILTAISHCLLDISSIPGIEEISSLYRLYIE
jgi:hypothetical protein